MKKLITLFLVAGAYFCINAQEYEYTPIVREGIEWGYLITSNHPDLVDGTTFYHIQFKGDTIIGGTSYKKCYAYNSCKIEDGNPTVIACLREENKMVYVRWTDNNPYALDPYDPAIDLSKEYLIYDFTSTEVSHITNTMQEIDNVIPVLINGKYRNLFKLGIFSVVEGLGISGYGNLTNPYTEMKSCYPCRNTFLNYVRNLESGEFEYLSYENDFFETYIELDYNANVPEYKDTCLDLNSVKSVNENQVQITQNASEITVKLPQTGYGVIELVNEAGVSVIKNIIDNAGSATISASGLQPGMYILVVSYENEKTTRKISVK